MKISYAILSHNLGLKLLILIKNLLKNIDVLDLIVIVDDYSDDKFTNDLFKKYGKLNLCIKIKFRKLNNNFSAQKNFLFDQCTGDYIFNLDADLNIDPKLIHLIKHVLLLNSLILLFWVPRINIVNGITELHIKKWG